MLYIQNVLTYFSLFFGGRLQCSLSLKKTLMQPLLRGSPLLNSTLHGKKFAAVAVQGYCWLRCECNSCCSTGFVVLI